MQFYYKLLWNTAFALFMGLCTCSVTVMAVDKIMHSFTDGIALLMAIAFMGFITYLYGMMAWMRIRGIPVIELADKELVIRDSLRKEVVIPYDSITDVSPCNQALRVAYQIDGKQKKKDINFMLVDVAEDDLYDFLNYFEQKLIEANDPKEECV